MYKVFFAILFLGVTSGVQSEVFEAVVAGVLPSAREDVGSFFDGQDSIIMMGGFDGLNLYDEVLSFNVTNHHIRQVSYFPTGITEGSVGSGQSGDFYYFGGDTGGSKSSNIWKLTAADPAPIPVANLPHSSRLHASASDGMGNIYIAGGIEGTIEERKSIMKYDTKTNEVTVVAKLPIGLHGASASWFGDALYVFGGVNSNGFYSNVIHEFTPSTGMLRTLEMQFGYDGIVYSSAVTVGRYIYIIGGTTPDGRVHDITRYDPLAETLEGLTVSNWDKMHSGVSTVYVPQNNRIYVIGGFTFVNNKIERLDAISYLQL